MNRHTSSRRSRWTRRAFLGAGTLAGAGALSGLYAWRVEPHWVELVERDLPLRGLGRELADSRLVQLSDLHIGPRVDDDYLLRTFERVRALGAEWVVYTGDFISYWSGTGPQIERMFDELPRGTRGTFAVLGNHDYGHNWSQPEVAESVTRLAERVGVRVLRNERVDLGGPDGLTLVGIDDLWGGNFDPVRATASLDRTRDTLILSHNPDTVDLPGWHDFTGWVLSGHTHGGQCKPPFLPPPILPVRNLNYAAGEVAIGEHRRLYVNRGLGHLIRLRFNVRPEVTVFRLVPALRPTGVMP